MEMRGSNPLAQLKKQIIGQKSAALPDVPPDPALQPLHEKMVEYDRYVSETVIRVLGGGKEAWLYPGDLELQQDLDRERQAGKAVEAYQNYKNRLDGMLGLAVQVVQQRVG